MLRAQTAMMETTIARLEQELAAVGTSSVANGEVQVGHEVMSIALIISTPH